MAMEHTFPSHAPRARKLTRLDLVPLAGFVLPTLLIGYGYVIPRSCIAGVNELTIGFATTILGACVTYLLGVRAALRR
jgi:hypothetical protein